MVGALACLAMPVAAASCGDSVSPHDAVQLAFSSAAVDLNGVASQAVVLENTGPVAVGPVAFVAPAGFVNDGGVAVAGMALEISPAEVATLNPGDSHTVSVRISGNLGSVPDGTYRTDLRAMVANEVRATVTVQVRLSVCGREPFRVRTLTGPTQIVQGSVVQYTVDVQDANGAIPVDACVSWSVAPASAGLIDAAGRFVAYQAGPVEIEAASGLGAQGTSVTVTARNLSGAFGTVGRGTISERYSSDLWVHGAVAYQGTWSSRLGNLGNTLYVWDVVNPASPILTDSVAIDARVVNDVKVRSDGTLAVITHESSTDGLNGVTLLDLTEPRHPTVVRRFFQSLEFGVHNAWIEGNYLYLVVDGVSPSSGLRILDVSDPGNPTVVSSFYAGSSFLHDVYVRDGLAFLSHWNAGLIVLDVGNGVAGGSPTAPVEVSRIAVSGGQTHNAWYWPDAGYIFVGEEDFASPGIMHVIDARDWADLREVATFRVEGTTPHNFWLDEASEVLYLAWYGNGLRALDVSGDLWGELDRQGREIASFQYGGSGSCPGSLSVATCTWAPQVHDGRIFVADMNTGLRILQPVGF